MTADNLPEDLHWVNHSAILDIFHYLSTEIFFADFFSVYVCDLMRFTIR